MKRILALAGVLCLLLTFSVTAKAAMVESWTYTANAVFTSWTNTTWDSQFGTSTNHPVTADQYAGGDDWVWSEFTGIKASLVSTLKYNYLVDPETGELLEKDELQATKTGFVNLNWPYDSANPSSLSVTGSSGVAITGESNRANGITLNSFINSSDPQVLKAGVVLLTLELIPAGYEHLAATYALELEFDYTRIDSQRDMFTIKPYLGSQEIDIEGTIYEFSFAEFFKANDLGNGQYGWVMPKGSSSATSFESWFTISAKELPPAPDPEVNATPEPGTVALMGLGLLGLFALNRKGRKQE